MDKNKKWYIIYIGLFIILLCSYWQPNRLILERFEDEMKCKYIGGNINKTTVLMHIYNEEYLLPFWLNHHKSMFDNIIIIDYRSTDNSVEICKTICPECTIHTSRNEMFDAAEVDKEIMDLEKNIEGIKITLNITEFLFCEKSIKDIFSNVNEPTSYSIVAYSPYSKNYYNPTTNTELFYNLLNDDIVFHQDRLGHRFIHTFSHGNYKIGRHITNNTTSPIKELHIIWLGFYPLNDKLLKRKLQIHEKIPQTDKDKGAGFQHLYTKDKLLSINEEAANSGKSLKDINLPLYNLLSSIYTI